MKKLIILLVLMSIAVWGSDLTDSETVELDKKVDKTVKLLQNDKVDVIVVGRVVEISSKLGKINPNKELIKGNRLPFTKVTFEVLNAYKGGGGTLSGEIIVRISGGRYTTEEGKSYVKFSPQMAFPLLDEGDVLLMGLKKLSNGDFKHVFGKDLQIPFTDEIIDQINDDTKEHKLRKLYTKDQYSSNRKEEKENLIIEKFEKKKKFEKKLIKKLKLNLKNSFNEMEVE